MATMREIRRRIRSITNTQQITRAMEMVAAAKLRKVQERALASRPYADQLRGVLERLAAQSGSEVQHPLLEERPVRHSAYLVVSGDRGLCGGYNSNILRVAVQALRGEADHERSVISVGRKGRDHLRRRNYTILKDYVDIGDNPSFSQAKELARELIELYENKTIDRLFLVYSQFISPVRQLPQVFPLLPIRRPEETKSAELQSQYIFEPAPAELFSYLLPRYVEIQIYQALLEAKAGEQGARMTAMGAATDNADDLIKHLTLTLNKARQAAITRELSEIVGTARAFE